MDTETDDRSPVEQQLRELIAWHRPISGAQAEVSNPVDVVYPRPDPE